MGGWGDGTGRVALGPMANLAIAPKPCPGQLTAYPYRWGCNGFSMTHLAIAPNPARANPPLTPIDGVVMDSPLMGDNMVTQLAA